MTWMAAERPDLPPGEAKSAPPAPARTETYPDHWWDEDHWTALKAAGPWREELEAMDLGDPPTDPDAIRRELDDILAKQASDGLPLRRQEIEEEADSPPPYYRRMMFLDDLRRPRTRDLVFGAVAWARPMIMHFKHRHRRPRPTQLEPLIRPVVDCPFHPAYPSGHSTQAHFVAVVAGAVSGRRSLEDALRSAAERIAENREYAGLHYRSDSLAGAELARGLLPIFERENAGAIEEARRAEW